MCDWCVDCGVLDQVGVLSVDQDFTGMVNIIIITNSQNFLRSEHFYLKILNQEL